MLPSLAFQSFVPSTFYRGAEEFSSKKWRGGGGGGGGEGAGPPSLDLPLPL